MITENEEGPGEDFKEESEEESNLEFSQEQIDSLKELVEEAKEETIEWKNLHRSKFVRDRDYLGRFEKYILLKLDNLSIEESFEIPKPYEPTEEEKVKEKAEKQKREEEYKKQREEQEKQKAEREALERLRKEAALKEREAILEEQRKIKEEHDKYYTADGFIRV